MGECAIGAGGLFEGGRLVCPRQDHAASSGVLAVRPEHMSLADRCPDGANGVAASVAATTYLGASMRLGLVTRGGTRLTVTLPAEAAASALAGGRDVWITWPVTKGFLLPEDRAEQLAVTGAQ